MTTEVETFRVLQVDSDMAYSRLLENTLANAFEARCNFQRVSRLADALKCLVAEAYDVILVDPELADSQGLDTLKQIHPYAEEAPIIVLAKEEQEQSVANLKDVAEDCLFKSQLDTNALIQSIRLAMARKAKRANVFDRERAKASVAEARQFTTRQADRRSHPRYLLTRPLVAIPVMPNGQPLEAFQAEGFTIDVSEGGIGFEVAGLERLPTRRLIIGMESDDGQMHYTSIDVRASLSVQGGLRIGGKFSTADRDVLRAENLIPRVNHQTHRFDTGLPTETLYKWGELGICHPVLIDRVLVCPECRAVPTLRHGCRACGSVHTASGQLIHHFACAHVDLVAAYEREGEIVCPKCRARHLVIGSDFEYLAGPYQCLDCHWSDTELELVGQCLACELRFPIEQASEEEIVGYHVNRLDPLALIEEP